MHQQIRTSTAKSPPDLEAVLDVLAREGFNLLAAGGSNVEEEGGEFAFAVDHKELKRAMKVLEDEGYAPRLVDVKLCWLENTPGQLFKCIAEARAENVATQQVIRDLTIGVADAKGRIPVQVYSEPATQTQPAAQTETGA